MTKLGAHIRKSARTPSRSQLVKMRVVVSGLRGVGVEAAKNLALAGPREVILHDPALVEVRSGAVLRMQKRWTNGALSSLILSFASQDSATPFQEFLGKKRRPHLLFGDCVQRFLT